VTGGGPVRVQQDGPLAVVTLDAPPLNLFDGGMIDGLRAAVDELSADHPRALLVRAEGRVVSGGVDVHLFDGLTPEDGARL
jgi:enoyl-CoA hydratase